MAPEETGPKEGPLVGELGSPAEVPYHIEDTFLGKDRKIDKTG